jgi:2-polyprenyl-3-methyl-5-hydroxy-6-metoxy-1,4-benzoquinol methylase
MPRQQVTEHAGDSASASPRNAVGDELDLNALGAAVAQTPATRTTATPLPAETRPYFEIANLELPIILDGLPKNLRVLDVGCGSGVHGAELRRIHAHHVTGVDRSVPSIQRARNRMSAAYVADVTCPEDYPFAGGFDVVLFSDLLEHMLDPDAVLAAHVKLLKPGGRILISLPNVAIWNVRLSLLFGSFRYRDTGTLDRTHLRFFTRRSLRELIANAGLREERSRITPGLIRPLVPLIKRLYDKPSAAGNSSSIMDSAPYRFYCRWLYPAERFLCSLCPGLLAFQFVALCRRSDPH